MINKKKCIALLVKALAKENVHIHTLLDDDEKFLLNLKLNMRLAAVDYLYENYPDTADTNRQQKLKVLLKEICDLHV